MSKLGMYSSFITRNLGSLMFLLLSAYYFVSFNDLEINKFVKYTVLIVFISADLIIISGLYHVIKSLIAGGIPLEETGKAYQQLFEKLDIETISSEINALNSSDKSIIQVKTLLNEIISIKHKTI